MQFFRQKITEPLSINNPSWIEMIDTSIVETQLKQQISSRQRLQLNQLYSISQCLQKKYTQKAAHLKSKQSQPSKSVSSYNQSYPLQSIHPSQVDRAHDDNVFDYRLHMKLAKGDGLFRVEEMKRKNKRRYNKEEAKDGKNKQEGVRGKYKKRHKSQDEDYYHEGAHHEDQLQSSDRNQQNPILPVNNTQHKPRNYHRHSNSKSSSGKYQPSQKLIKQVQKLLASSLSNNFTYRMIQIKQGQNMQSDQQSQISKQSIQMSKGSILLNKQQKSDFHNHSINQINNQKDHQKIIQYKIQQPKQSLRNLISLQDNDQQMKQCQMLLQSKPRNSQQKPHNRQQIFINNRQSFIKNQIQDNRTNNNTIKQDHNIQQEVNIKQENPNILMQPQVVDKILQNQHFQQIINSSSEQQVILNQLDEQIDNLDGLNLLNRKSTNIFGFSSNQRNQKPCFSCQIQYEQKPQHKQNESLSSQLLKQDENSLDEEMDEIINQNLSNPKIQKQRKNSLMISGEIQQIDPIIEQAQINKIQPKQPKQPNQPKQPKQPEQQKQQKLIKKHNIKKDKYNERINIQTIISEMHVFQSKQVSQLPQKGLGKGKNYRFGSGRGVIDQGFFNYQVENVQKQNNNQNQNNHNQKKQ